MSDAQRAAAARTARAAGGHRRPVGNEADPNAPKGADEAKNVQDAGLPGTNPGNNSPDPNPYNQNPPCKVWMGVQVCGARNSDVAKSLARNLFNNDFARCLEVTKEDIEDTFKSLGV